MTRDKGSGSVFYDEGRARWKGTLEVGYSKSGARRRKTVIGRTKREALNKLKDLERELLKYGVPAERLRGSTTLKTWSDRWLAQAETKLRPGAFNATRSQVGKWIVPQIGSVRLDRLAPSDITSVSQAILAEGLAVSTANRAHRELLRMLKDARAEGYPIPERVLDVSGPGVGTSDRTAIPLPDTLAFLTVASQRPDAARWVLAFLQGLRPAEALGLTWDSVDFDAGSITIQWQLRALSYNKPRNVQSGFRVPNNYEIRQLQGRMHLTRPKSASGWRVIPLTPMAADALLSWREIAPASLFNLVFPDERGLPRNASKDRDEFRAIQSEAGISNTGGSNPRPYALYEARHTTATMLRNGGTDDATLIAIMGHSSILSTKPYLHTDQEALKRSMNAVEERLQQQ